MNKCLITKLNGVVNNDSIPKLGELIIEVENAEDKTLEFYGGTNFSDIKVRTVGDITMKKGSTDKIRLVSGTGTIFLSGENRISGLVSFSQTAFHYPNLRCSFLKMIDTLVMSNAGYDTPMDKCYTKIEAYNTNVVGKLPNSCRDVLIRNCTYEGGKVLSVEDIPVNSNSKRVHVLATPITGDVSRFNNVPDVAFWGNPSTLYGDISKLKKNGGLLPFTINKTANTWSNRPSDYKIISFEANLGNDIDKMLINQATLQPAATYDSKTFTLVGNRTSASDAALATLQGMGFTISITPA